LCGTVLTCGCFIFIRINIRNGKTIMEKPAQEPLMIPLGRLQGTVAAAPGMRVATTVNSQPGPIHYSCYDYRVTGTIKSVRLAYIGHSVTIILDEKLASGGNEITISIPSHRSIVALSEGE
jgi:hypothetical protein